MKADLLRAVPEDAALEREWDALAEQMEEPAVSFTFAWVRLAARAAEPPAKPFLVLGRNEEGKLTGIAALSTQGDHARFLAAPVSDYCDFISTPAERAEVIKLTLGELRKNGIREFTAEKVPLRSGTLKILKTSAAPSGYHAAQFSAGAAPRIEINDATRPKLKSQIEKRLKLNSAQKPFGPFAFSCFSGSPMHSGIRELVRAQEKRFAETGRGTVPSELRRFLQDCGELPQARLFVLSARCGAMAWAIVLEWGPRWLYFMPTFDPEYSKPKKLRPGWMLLDHIVGDAIAKDVQVLDLGIGDEPYKSRYANAQNWVSGMLLTRSLARYVRVAAKTRLAEHLGNFPGINEAVRRLTGRTQ